MDFGKTFIDMSMSISIVDCTNKTTSILDFQIYYPRRVAMVLHCVPVGIFFIMPFLLHLLSSGSRSWFAIVRDFVKGKE